MKTTKNGILIGIALLLCMTSISAFAVSSSYWSGNPLTLNAGETRNFSIVLQNLGATSDLTVKASITGGSEVLKFTDSSDVYVVPAGEKKLVNLEAVIPANAIPGQTYDAKLDFSEVKQSNSGEFGFGTAIGQGFSIIVSQPSAASGTPLVIYFAIGIAVALLILLIVLKMKKKPKSRKK
jgi:hypothetical protein